jgi:acyl-CoA synthetase (AMP-forming)/AMP-acid ligase II
VDAGGFLSHGRVEFVDEIPKSASGKILPDPRRAGPRRTRSAVTLTGS